MSSKDGLDPLRRCDWFAEPITLRLDRERYLKTPSGGVLTILFALTTITYLLWQFQANQNKFYLHDSVVDLGNTNGTIAEEFGYEQKLFVFYLDSTGVATNYTNMWQLFQVAYVALEYQTSDYDSANDGWLQPATYPLEPCTRLEESNPKLYDEIVSQAGQGLDGSYCYLTDRNPKISLQGHESVFGMGNLPTYDQKYGQFVLAPCSSFTDITTVECAPLDDSIVSIENTLVELKTFTLQPNPVQFTKNQESGLTFYKMDLYTFGFIENYTQILSLTVQPQSVAYFLSYISDVFSPYKETYFPTLAGLYSLMTYNVGYQISGYIPQCYVIVKLQLDGTQVDLDYKRVTMFYIFAQFGGILFGLLSIAKLINGKLNNFATDNQIMRKLYSVNKNDHPSYNQKEYPEDDFAEPGEFYKHMNQLTSFSYSWLQWVRRGFCKWRCFCCKCCKDSPADRIFYKGRERLVHELDILQIVKQLRICAFLNQLQFRQFQIDIVPFFQRYCIRGQYTQYDDLAAHPGQLIEDVTPNLDSSSSFNKYDEEILRSMQYCRKLVNSRDLLQSNKMKLSRDLQTKLHKDDDPTDLAIIKNVFGEQFDVDKLEEIYQDIIDPPYEDEMDEGQLAHYQEQVRKVNLERERNAMSINGEGLPQDEKQQVQTAEQPLLAGQENQPPT